MFAHLLGELSPAVRAPSRHLHRVKQQPYFPVNASGTDMGMGPHAFLYRPRSCSAHGRAYCRVHVVYHGCDSSVTYLNSTDIVLHAGFNPWAEANSVMLLYPQSKGDLCWDWTGTYTPHENDIYDTRRSPQLLVVNRMVDALQRSDDLPLDPCLEPTCKAEYGRVAVEIAREGEVEEGRRRELD